MCLKPRRRIKAKYCVESNAKTTDGRHQVISEIAIREARPEDVARMVEMGRRFPLEGPSRDQVADNYVLLSRILEKCG